MRTTVRALRCAGAARRGHPTPCAEESNPPRASSAAAARRERGAGGDASLEVSRATLPAIPLPVPAPAALGWAPADGAWLSAGSSAAAGPAAAGVTIYGSGAAGRKRCWSQPSSERFLLLPILPTWPGLRSSVRTDPRAAPAPAGTPDHSSLQQEGAAALPLTTAQAPFKSKLCPDGGSSRGALGGGNPRWPQGPPPGSRLFCP